MVEIPPQIPKNAILLTYSLLTCFNNFLVGGNQHCTPGTRTNCTMSRSQMRCEDCEVLDRSL